MAMQSRITTLREQDLQETLEVQTTGDTFETAKISACDEWKTEEDTQECMKKDTADNPPSMLARKYTNVTFPRGFSPSQCSLLASRQRSTNYLFFLTNEKGKFLSNQTAASGQSGKSIRKNKKTVSPNHVIGSGSQAPRHLKPVLPVLAEKEISVSKSCNPMTRINTQTGSTRFQNFSQTGLTRKTIQTRWRSKEEIEQGLLEVQPSDTHAEIQRVGRSLRFEQRRRHDASAPESRVYLFNQKKSLGSMRSTAC